MNTKTEISSLIKEYQSDLKNGLTNATADKLLNKNGKNALKAKKKTNIIIKFIMEFNDILIVILLIAALISYIIDPNDYIESIIILVVVFLNAFLGVFQENKAEKSLEALKKLSMPTAKVIRDGTLKEIDSILLVPGDILICEAGDYISADGRIIECSNFKVDESALTGESLPVNKHSGVIIEENLALGDQKNCVFSSTFVTNGRAHILVTGTGMETEIGKIAFMLLESKEEKTPLQIKLDQIGRIIGIGAILICVIVFILETIATGQYLDSFKSAVSLAVAAIPEGLSTVVTVILAFGVQKMVKKKAIVKKLPAVETLGCASVICSDKTGTLTENKMTVVKICKADSVIKELNKYITDEDRYILEYFAICSDAKIIKEKGQEKKIGDPTEIALIEASNLYSNKEKIKYIRIADIPFDSERKLMSVIIKRENKYYLITKGAPDIVLDRCINSNNKTRLVNANNEMARKALRVLGVAYKELAFVPSHLEAQNLEKDLTFLGLVGMIDPARKEVKAAINEAKNAGVRTVMITGDHIITAQAIAKELEILDGNSLAITSKELSALSDDELYQNIEKYAVYARVAPEDKVRIVKAWQRKGHVVAMTGDGVNDSPALKSADIGCAMGITGTDVSKEAAAMILVDDNFATIVSAIKEGRGIYDNIKKTVQYLLSSNIGEVITIFVASLLAVVAGFDFGIPLLPIHLLWINLVTDSLPAFALGLEDVDVMVMTKKPRGKKESFFTGGLGFTIIWQGIFIGSVTLIAYVIGNNASHEIGMTMAFLTLSTIQLFHAFNIKSSKTIFDKQVFNNKFLWLSLIVGLTLELVLIYNDFLRSIFKLEYLELKYLLICFWLSFSIIIVVEIIKVIKKVKRNKRIK